MHKTLLDFFYMATASAGVFAAIYLTLCGQWVFAALALLLGLIVWADAETWQSLLEKGKEPSSHWFLIACDFVGVLSAAFIVTAVLVAADSNPITTLHLYLVTALCVLYILCCLAFWAALSPFDARLLNDFQEVHGVSDAARGAYIWGFGVAVVILLGFIAWLLFWLRPETPANIMTGWRVFTVLIGVYFAMYCLLVRSNVLAGTTSTSLTDATGPQPR